MRAKQTEKKSETLTRVRLDVNDAEHRHLRVAAAEANLSMSAYARKLVRQDMGGGGR